MLPRGEAAYDGLPAREPLYRRLGEPKSRRCAK